MKIRFKGLWLAPVLACLFLSGCLSSKIARIKADPSRYRDKTVRVEGTVTRSYGALIAGVYEIEDETGKIYVISNTGVPSKGSRVGVEGTVMNGLTLGDRSFGAAIRERTHKVR